MWIKNYFLIILSKLTFGLIELRKYKVVQKYRYELSKNIANTLNYTVSQGPFKGLKLNKEIYWGQGDIANKCLGFYEYCIQNLILSSQSEVRYSKFVDIGGADGFYACGCIINGLFDNSIVYEKSDVGREMIKKSSENNNFTDKVFIKGAVSKDELLRDVAEGAFILCDIEGEEYNLFDKLTLSRLSACRIIIEIHEFDGSMCNKSNALLEMCKDYFDVKVVRPYYDTLQHPVLDNLNDNERLLILSEGRKKLAKWFYLVPKLS